MGIRVHLSSTEAEVARLVGKRRQEADAGFSSTRAMTGDVLQASIDAAGAEIAVARALNLFPDLDTTPRRGGCDLVGKDLRTIDVKQTTHPSGRLLVKHQTRTGESEYYILVVGTLPDYDLVGWARASEIMRPERMTDPGQGMAYALSQDDLHKFRMVDLCQATLQGSRKPSLEEKSILLSKWRKVAHKYVSQ